MRLDCALPAGVDPRRHARSLSRIWEAKLAGGAEPVGARPIIAESWDRVLRMGVDPDRGGELEPEGGDGVERRRAESRIAQVVHIFRSMLVSLAEDGVHIMVITDEEGRLLWREGTNAVLSKADSLGFVEGARWDEGNVGTNGIGTSLAVRKPVQIFAAEHFVRTHHPWICTAVPMHDPVDGRLLGVVDVSGPAATAHPNTLALVGSVTRLAEESLRTAHDAALAQLRAVAAPVLARMGGPALVTDRNGWVAAASELLPPVRVLLPKGEHEGQGYVPSIGWCRLEPLFDGWLIRVDKRPPDRSTSLRVDFDRGRATVTVVTSGGIWRHRLSPRHVEILLILARHPEGRTAAELSTELFGDAEHTVAVRAELSRLRRRLGGLIEQRPYRFPRWLEVTCDLPDDAGPTTGNGGP